MSTFVGDVLQKETEYLFENSPLTVYALSHPECIPWLKFWSLGGWDIRGHLRRLHAFFRAQPDAVY
jgi:hypothetical protein